MIIAGIESLIKAKNTPIAMRKWNRCEKCLSLVDQAAKRFGGSMLLSSFLRKYLLTASKKKRISLKWRSIVVGVWVLLNQIYRFRKAVLITLHGLLAPDHENRFFRTYLRFVRSDFLAPSFVRLRGCFASGSARAVRVRAGCHLASRLSLPTVRLQCLSRLLGRDAAIPRQNIERRRGTRGSSTRLANTAGEPSVELIQLASLGCECQAADFLGFVQAEVACPWPVALHVLGDWLGSVRATYDRSVREAQEEAVDQVSCAPSFASSL